MWSGGALGLHLNKEWHLSYFMNRFCWLRFETNVACRNRRRSRLIHVPQSNKILPFESIPPWAFCLTAGMEQGQEMFDDARILFPCPKGVNR